MAKIVARKLLEFSTDQLWEILTGVFTLVFDDGQELEVDYKQTLFSSYFWDYHRKYKNTPLLAKHHVKSITKDGYIVADTLNKILETVYWSVADIYQLKDPYLRQEITEMVFRTMNVSYNEIQLRTEAYVTTLDALDFVQVIKHPRIIEAKSELDGSKESIRKCHAAIDKVLNDDPTLNNNNLAKAVRAKRVKIGQVHHCVGPLGHRAEVDNLIFNRPVLKSYAEGMSTVYEVVAESRSAAKSLFFSEAPLQDSEYFSRRLQLVTVIIEKIHYEDCGNTDFENWRLRGPYTRPDGSFYPGDLTFMVGKYYWDDANNLKMLSLDDKHLYGENIKLRTVGRCKHPDQHTVCQYCFGGMADNINPYANVGHVSSGTMCLQTTQNTLGTKHLTGSSVNDPIILDAVSGNFFTTDREKMRYYVKPAIVRSRTKIKIPNSQVMGITDIFLVEDVRKLSNTRTSAVSEVVFESVITSTGEIIRTAVEVGKHNKPATLSYEFLSYLKEVKWEVDKDSFITVDLSKWKHQYPIIELPPMEVSYAEHSKTVAAMIESNKEDLKSIEESENSHSRLMSVFDIANSKLNVNLSLIEIILYAYTVVDGEEDAMQLPRNRQQYCVAPRNPIIMGRSLSNSYAFQLQENALLNPMSFFKLKRPDSIFDVCIRPEEVVNEVNRTK